MDKKQLETLVADLGYALMYLKQAQMEGLAYAPVNRARELVSKVGDALIKEMDKTPAKMKGRAWNDPRQAKAIQLAQRIDLFKDAKLTMAKLDELYQIVCRDNEDWDGEEVSPETIAKLMVTHYARFGVRSSIP